MFECLVVLISLRCLQSNLEDVFWKRRPVVPEHFTCACGLFFYRVYLVFGPNPGVVLVFHLMIFSREEGGTRNNGTLYTVFHDVSYFRNVRVFILMPLKLNDRCYIVNGR